jgi:DNA-binding NarL/FixJ family response regulator
MLPAGLSTTETTRIEFFARDKKAYAFYAGKIVHLFELPAHIVNTMRREMNAMPARCKTLGIDTIENENERLEAYIVSEYPIVDNVADYDNRHTNPEVYGTDAINFYKLSPREVQLLKLLAEGDLLPEVSRKMHIEYSTAEVHSHHIKQKINAKNSADMIRFAIRAKLVDA